MEEARSRSSRRTTKNTTNYGSTWSKTVFRGALCGKLSVHCDPKNLSIEVGLVVQLIPITIGTPLFNDGGYSCLQGIAQ